MFYPHFNGFSAKSSNFLRKLKRNNSREWFHANKETYELEVKFPMKSLIQDLGDHFRSQAPEISFDTQKSIFRINRDIRFSNDKSPYKTNIGAFFRLGAKKEFEDVPGLYIHFAPNEVFVAGGLYMPSSRQTRSIRLAMLDDPESYLSIIKNKKFKKSFPEGIEGENLKRAPSGIAIDHPLIEHLRHKQFYVSRSYTEKDAFQKSFLKKVIKDFEVMLPLVYWLNRVLQK